MSIEHRMSPEKGHKEDGQWHYAVCLCIVLIWSLSNCLFTLEGGEGGMEERSKVMLRKIGMGLSEGSRVKQGGES